ncbi:MAG: hypothetical protein IT439_08755 [Phycisphaerales bacterium]|nr:hypothetical protein [Phycisphaerales bacterium]
MRPLFLFSLARSGSSIAAYAGGSPWRLPVADEILGPWDRTGPPYHYPSSQARLVEDFKAAGHTLTPEVVSAARQVLREIGTRHAEGGAGAFGARGVVIFKWPHLRPAPDAWREAFPEGSAAYLIRNPLHRLNSLIARGWTGSFGPKFDLERFVQFAKWWTQQPHRLAYDTLSRDPGAFFSALWTAWGLAHGAGELAQAAAYTRTRYHGDSGRTSDMQAGPVMSERRFVLPREAVSLYLEHPFARGFMEEMGWPVRPEDYGIT